MQETHTGLFPLRPRQQLALDCLKRAVARGQKRVQIQAPCGFGKTVIGAHIVDGARSKGNHVSFVVPYLGLIDQTFEKFCENGIDPGDMGVIQGNHPWRRPAAPIQICSVQTIDRREFPDSRIVVVDESHLGFAAVQSWMDERPDAIFVGLSATPWRRGMREQWHDNLIVPASTRELIEEGALSPYRAFAPTKPDLQGIRTVAGDYHEGQLGDRMSEKTIVGDVVKTWCDLAEGRPTLLFAVNRRHAVVLEAQFRDVGIPVGYIDADTPREDRLALKKQFHSGEIKVLCSVGTMIAGMDWDVRCISFCRPTKSEILFVQAIGRGLRTAPGKENLLLLDHSGTVLSLGLPDEIIHERMLPGKTANGGNGKEEDDDKPAGPIECRSCGLIVEARSTSCPGCGAGIRYRTGVSEVDGELEEVGRGALKVEKNKRPFEVLTMEQKAVFFGELRYYAKEHGYKEGWASQRYREKTGVWPNHPTIRDAPYKPLSPATAGWLRSRQIAYAHSRANHHQPLRGENP